MLEYAMLGRLSLSFHITLPNNIQAIWIQGLSINTLTSKPELDYIKVVNSVIQIHSLLLQ